MNPKTAAENLVKEYKLKPANIREATDLSYRRLQVWDKAGVLPTADREDESWREYTGKDLIVLLTFKEIRDKLQIPPIKLKKLYDWMQNVGWLEDVLSKYRLCPVYIITNLENKFLTVLEGEIEEMTSLGAEPQIIFKLDPVLKAAFEVLHFEDFRRLGDGTDLSRDNRKVLVGVLKSIEKTPYAEINLKVRNHRIVEQKIQSSKNVK